MSLTLTRQSSVFPVPISEHHLLEILRYAGYSGWKAEQMQDGDTEAATLNRYLTGTSLSERDANELHKAIVRVIEDSTINKTPAFVHALQVVESFSEKGAFRIQRQN